MKSKKAVEEEVKMDLQAAKPSDSTLSEEDNPAVSEVPQSPTKKIKSIHASATTTNDENKDEEDVLAYLLERFPSLKLTGCFFYIDADGRLAAANDEVNEMISNQVFSNNAETF